MYTLPPSPDSLGSRLMPHCIGWGEKRRPEDLRHRRRHPPLVRSTYRSHDSHLTGTSPLIPIFVSAVPSSQTRNQQIVNATWRLENTSNNIPNLSRWIRCLFSLALTSAPELVEHLLSQVVTIANGAKTVRCSWFPQSVSLPLFDSIHDAISANAQLEPR